MRVALLHNIISPHSVALFERLAASATQSNLSLKVYFLAETDKNRRWRTSIEQDFWYRILPNFAIRLHGQDLFTYFVNPTLPFELVHNGFDVVIVDGWDSFASVAAFGLAKLLRKRFVLWAGSTANEPSWRRTLALPLVRLLVSNADGYIAYGTRARDYLLQMGAYGDRISIAYNTVDVEWFEKESDRLRPQRQAIRAAFGLSNGPVILYVGQLIRRKGIMDLLDAYEILVHSRPDVQLLVAGAGQLEPILRERAMMQRLDGVRFIGHVATSDLPRLYTSADCFALPSHEEVWGLVLNEAAACSLPLVAAEPVGAAPDLIVPGMNGLVVRPGSPPDLARALAEALDHSLEWGLESRRTVLERATYDQNTAAITTLLRRFEPGASRARAALG